MAAIEVTITGVMYDKLNRTTQQVVLIGEASLTGIGIGGGPMPPGQGGGGSPPGIWGPPGPWPSPPIQLPPGVGSGNPPHPAHPIVLPPDQVPPDQQPPQTPPPGTVTPVPPPEGSGGWPVTGIVPPPYVVLYYPGVGPVYVTPPPHTEPNPQQQSGGGRRG